MWVFQETVVCLHCGFTEFTVPKRELQVLETGSPVEGAVVGHGQASGEEKRHNGGPLGLVDCVSRCDTATVKLNENLQGQPPFANSA